MAKAAKITAMFIALALAGYFIYAKTSSTYRIRYRLTLEIEDNGKPIAFSQVVEIRYGLVPDALANIGQQTRKVVGEFHGAAPTIDLGNNGLVFVINLFASDRFSVSCPKQFVETERKQDCMRSRSLSDLPLAAFGYPVDLIPSQAAEYLSQLQSRRDSVDIPLENLPMLVHFRNDANPSSIEEVDPLNLVKTFGPGVFLVRAQLAMTDAPISGPSDRWPPFLLKLSHEANTGDVRQKIMAGMSPAEVAGTVAFLRPAGRYVDEQIHIQNFLEQ